MDKLDCLEVVADGFFNRPTALHALSTLFPCLPHAVNTSVGSQIEDAYLDRLQPIIETTAPPFFSDHLCYTHEEQVRIGHLAPIPYTDESLETVTENVRTVQDRLGVPLALENIAMPFYWPVDTMSETEFFTDLVSRTGCMILLDLENLRINSHNHGFDAQDYLENLPFEQVAQVHLAGGVWSDGMYHDTHSSLVPEATWALFEHLCGLVTPPSVVIEHDHGFPPFHILLEQIQKAKNLRGGSDGA